MNESERKTQLQHLQHLQHSQHLEHLQHVQYDKLLTYGLQLKAES